MKRWMIFLCVLSAAILHGQDAFTWQMEVDSFMNRWHHAAAVADEDVFFGSMHKDCIYIGTDSSEYWLRDELKAWSAKYFDRESAWAFTPISRNSYRQGASDLIWFDELLETWMGPCRASGIIMDTPEGLRLKHYHLSIAVPNDVVNGYLQLIGRPAKN